MAVRLIAHLHTHTIGQYFYKLPALLLLFILSNAIKAQECEWLVAPNSRHAGWVTAIDDSNNIILGSRIKNLHSFYSYDTAIQKHNQYGGIIWAKKVLYKGEGVFFITDIETDENNDIYVVGEYSQYMGYNDTNSVDFGDGVILIDSIERHQKYQYNYNVRKGCFIFKLNSSGNILWARLIIGLSTDPAILMAPRLTLESNKNPIIGFSFQDSLSFEGTVLKATGYWGDIALIKYDANGNYLKHLKISSDYAILEDIDIDADNNLYIVGYSQALLKFGASTLPGDGKVLLKLTSDLTPLKGVKSSTKIVSGVYVSGKTACQLSVADNGKIVLSGIFFDTVSFGGIILPPINNDSTVSHFIAYIDTSLSFIWMKRSVNLTKSRGTVFSMGVSVRNKNIYAGGISNIPTKYGNFTINPKGIFLIKMDTLGNFLWAFGSQPSELNNTIADLNGDCIVTGNYIDTVTIFDRQETGTSGYFLAKISDYSITRGYVSAGPYCAGDSIKIPYTKIGRFNAGNEFIAQLSDSTGNFDGGERELGRRTDTVAGIVTGSLPLFNVATNNKYRIRILSTNPPLQSYYKYDTLKLLIYSRDTANAGADITACKGQQINLGVTGGSKWKWWPTTGFINPADSANRSPKIKADSSVEYRIIISDSTGCGQTDTDYVKVNILPELKIIAPDTVAFCKGTQAVITATAVGGNTTRHVYTWIENSNGKDSLLSTSSQLIITPDTITIYKVILSDSCSLNFDSAFVTVIPLKPLLVTINPDTTICFGGKVKLQASTTGGNATTHSVLWTVDNGPWTSNSLIDTVLPTVTTTYTATLTDGCTVNPDSAKITITVRPPLSVTVNADTTICLGQSTTLRANLSGGYTPSRMLQWSDNYGTFSDTNTLATISPAKTTTYKALLTDNCSTPADSAQITITVRSPLKVTLNPDTTICTGQSVLLSAIISGGDTANHSLLWTVPGNTFTDTNKNITAKPIATTTYQALLWDNCTQPSDSAQVTITVRPPLQISTFAKDSICDNQTVTLTANITGGNALSRNVLWTAYNGLLSTTQNPVADTPKITTTYIATLSDNCSPDVFDTLTVTVLPAPRAAFNYTPQTGCPPLLVEFADISTGNDTTLNTWKIENIETVGLKEYAYNFVAPGNYTVGLTVGNVLGCTDNIFIDNVISVFAKPLAQFIIKPEIREIESPLYLYNQSQRATSYTWNFGDGNQLHQNNNHDTGYSYTDTGIMAIQLIAQNEKGCLDTQTQLIRVFDKINCEIPNAFTPNNDYLNPVFAPVCLGVATYHMTIYNRWGQVMLDCDDCTWDGTYVGNLVQAGIYLYQLKIIAGSKKEGTSFGMIQVLR
jgi:gliding motility-associated-like protein